MTIKLQGGIFRRNPTFNDVEVDGTLTVGGNAVPDASTLLVDGDIGSTVQGYDADTAKYDDTTANFTGTLQNGGSNVVVDTDIGSTVEAYDSTILKSADIGSTVQAYDADTAKLDVAQSYSETQNFSDVTLGTSVTPLAVMHFAADTNESSLPSIVLQDTGTGDTRLGYLTNASGDIVLAATASITDQRARISLQDDRNITFSTSNGERARINSNGLSFNGDTAAANALSDYEEGSWTPSPSSGSITVTDARYTKIGRQVTVSADVTATATTSGDWTGLPFTNGAEQAVGVVGYQDNSASETWGVMIDASTTNFTFRLGTTTKQLTTGKRAMFIATYFVG